MFLFATQMTVYTYNWSTDAQGRLEDAFRRMMQWQNARSHLLSCIVSQKMGLYRHTAFSDLADPCTAVSLLSAPFSSLCGLVGRARETWFLVICAAAGQA